MDILKAPVLGRGFRPFFLLGAVYSALSILIWAGAYSGYIIAPVVFSDPVSWHAHEMVYGFALAIVAGFLLTAVPNWTGGAPVRQIRLLALVLIWGLARVLMNVELGLPRMVVIMGATIFTPVLAFMLAIPLIKSWSKRNFIFLGILGVLFFSDLAFLLTEEREFLYVALLMVGMMISLVGGRVIPSFTTSALRQGGHEVSQKDQPIADGLAMVSLVGVGACLLVFGPLSPMFGGIALLSSAIHAIRFRHYHTVMILKQPMLWILHAGFSWLIVGLFLLGLAGFGWIAFSPAIHALTVGSIGSMTLGMMCRVALGHTGRPIIARKVVKISFFLMQGAGIMRVFGPLLAAEFSVLWILGSAVLWSVCFLLYVIFYAPILWGPRIDGEEA